MSQCLSCQFYDRNGGRAAEARTSQWGLCRRAAPQLHPTNGKSHAVEGIWPTVRDDDWCGQWEGRLRKSAEEGTSAATANATVQPQPRVAPAFPSAARALPSHGGAAAIAAGYKPTPTKALK